MHCLLIIHIHTKNKDLKAYFLIPAKKIINQLNLNARITTFWSTPDTWNLYKKRSCKAGLWSYM